MDSNKAQAPGGTDPARLSEMIRTLASDEFEGRAPGTPGEEKTVEWLVAQFEALGLEPGGADGGWTQPVPLLHTKVDQGTPFVLAGPGGTQRLVQGRDLYVSTQRDVERIRINKAPLVFVGYGVTAPEAGWDDYKDVDLKGKVAVFLVNDPDFAATESDDASGKFGGQAMTYYGRWSYKFEEAVRRGAIAALIVHDTDAAGYGWNTIQSPVGENYDLVRDEGAAGKLMAQGWFSHEESEKLFADAGLDLAALRVKARSRAFQPVAFEGFTLSADVPVENSQVMSRNIIAKISGSERPEETISFAAHWDAYGKSDEPDADGRTIRAGALDDASGVAGVVELARLFKEGAPPERTLLFAAWTAEERGLLGAEAFMDSGLYPVDKMVANLTLDTLQPNGPAKDIILIGKGQNSLEDDMGIAAQAQGRVVTPDTAPERGMYFRADHFAFAKRGVPSLIVMALGGGVDLVDGGRERGDQWVSDFTAQCYHQTCDVWHEDWDLRGMAQDIDLVYAIGRKLANSEEWPSWRPESEFAKLR